MLLNLNGLHTPVNQITLTGTKQGPGHCWTEWSLSSSSNSLCVDCYFPCEKNWPKVNEGDFSLLRNVETEAWRGSLAPECHTGKEKKQDSDNHFCTHRWIPKPLQPSSSFPWPSSSPGSAPAATSILPSLIQSLSSLHSVISESPDSHFPHPLWLTQSVDSCQRSLTGSSLCDQG